MALQHIPRLNPQLVKLALFKLGVADDDQTKQADMGGMGGAPPMGGAAPPPDPAAAAGGAAPAIDPAIQQAIQQAVQQASGGAPGMPGKGGGKKAEQQMLDAKLWAILYVNTQIAEKLGIQLPPSVLIGPPPDPMAMQAAQQEMGNQQGGASAASATAPPPDQSAIAPIDPMQAAAPKMASILGSVYDDNATVLAEEPAATPAALSWVSAARDRARSMANLAGPTG